MKNWIIVLLILLLSLLDQVIKVVIESAFLDVRFDIIPNLIEFRPKYNFDYSYLNQILDLGMSFWATLLLTIFFGVLFLLVYRLLRYYSKHKTLLDWSSVFIFSSLVCALLSHVFWKGVLDYIYLKPLFIFDLKDIYVWIGVVLVLFAQIKDVQNGVAIKWKDVKQYFSPNKKGSE